MSKVIISVRTHNTPTTPPKDSFKLMYYMFIVVLLLLKTIKHPKQTFTVWWPTINYQNKKTRKLSIRKHQILFTKEKSQLLSQQNKTSTQAFVQIWTVCWWLHNKHINTLRLIRAWLHNIWGIGYKYWNLKN